MLWYTEFLVAQKLEVTKHTGTKLQLTMEP